MDIGFIGLGHMGQPMASLPEAKALGVPNDVMSAVAANWEAVNAENGGDSDFSTVIQPLERRAGVTFAATGKKS